MKNLLGVDMSDNQAIYLFFLKARVWYVNVSRGSTAIRNGDNHFPGLKGNIL
jgi:hypothetical protein